jgi:hypothetical protein
MGAPAGTSLVHQGPRCCRIQIIAITMAGMMTTHEAISLALARLIITLLAAVTIFPPTAASRIYTSLPVTSITGYRVIPEERPESDHRPVVAIFDVDGASERSANAQARGRQASV